jgi:uroporphyrinogen-III decarboxylase
MGELTGRQRLLRVFNQRQIDRIPVSPFIHINYVKEFYGSQEVDWVAKTPEVYRHFGFDLVHRNCTPVYDAYGPAGPDWQIEVTRAQEGRNETTTTTIHTPDGSLRCVEALRWVYEYDAESSPVEYPIKDQADLDRLIRYQPPPGPVDVSDIHKARAAVGEEGVIAPWIQGAFNLAAFYYRELSALVMDAMTTPRFYERMMQHLLERYKIHVQQLIDAGVDMLSYGGNIANAKLIGPDFYRTHIWPYEKQLIDFIQQQGVIVLYHNCGYASNLLPLYPSLGMRAYESLTPPPYGDTILDQAIEIFGTGTTLSGNIDQLDLLRKGTAQEIDRAVQQTLDTVRGRAHFVLATTDYFNENTPHDNIHALAQAGRQHGRL